MRWAERDQSNENFVCLFCYKKSKFGVFMVLLKTYIPTSDSNINSIEPLILFYFDLSSFNFLNHWKIHFSRIMFWKINNIFLRSLLFHAQFTTVPFQPLSELNKKDDVVAENYQF